MAIDDTQFQLVTFQLGNEVYGVDILDVQELVKAQTVRAIPHAPYYVEGIFNLRGEVIPIMSLHKRFQIDKLSYENAFDAELNRGFIILDIDNIKISIIIDRIVRVISIDPVTIKPPPQMLTGIGSEYIHGIVQDENNYLIILDARKLFDSKELQKLLGVEV
ncbi:MAG: chemotaxis protein CheW [Spirochaetales bacterium]